MKVIQKISAVFLAIVFLFSSLGFTIGSMVCIKSGKEKISLVAIDDCCGKKNEKSLPSPTDCCDDDKALASHENDTIIKSDDCCNINNFTLKLKDFQNTQKSTIEQPASLNLLFSFSKKINLSASEKILAFHSSEIPMPLSGKTLLNFISILII